MLNNVNTYVARMLILAMFLAILAILIVYGTTHEKESVELSEIHCVRSICVESKLSGESCLVLDARVSEVVIESSRGDSTIKNIRVIPSTDRCL